MLRSFFTTPVTNDIAYSPAIIAQSVAEGLHELGHDVTYFGPEGTHLRCNVETCNMRPFFNNMADFDAQVSTTDMFEDYRFALYDLAMARTMLERAKAGEFDCVLFNHFESVLPLAPLYPEVPIVYILHDEMDEKRREMIDLHRSPNQYFISISNSQRRDAPDLNYVKTIYNGIDTEAYAFSDHAENYLLFVGRITPAKGVKEAVQIARQAKRRLLIAGNLSRADYWYFDEYIKPYLDDQILFLGMLGREQVVKYFQKAQAMLAPVQWQEPFGLTLAEANACGTPVIAFNRGAIPEVIKDGTTGYVVDNSAEMIMALDTIDRIKRQDCRNHAVSKFSRELMVKNYEKTLKSIVATHRRQKKKITELSAKDISQEFTRFSKSILKTPRRKK